MLDNTVSNACTYCGKTIPEETYIVCNCTINDFVGQLGAFCNQRCADNYGQSTGEVLGVQYTGDVNPLHYGGVWYTVDNRWKIADVVQAVDVGVEGVCWVEEGSLDLDYAHDNTSRARFEDALQSYGLDLSTWEDLYSRDILQATRIQVDCMLGYWGLSSTDLKYYIVDRNNYTKQTKLDAACVLYNPRIHIGLSVKLWNKYDGNLDTLVREELLP